MVYFSVPVADVSGETRQCKARCPPARGRVEESPRMGRVIVVEDDQSIGRLIESVLVDEGHEIEWVRNPDDLWPRLEEQPPDLMLMDLLIGGTDSRRWFAELRERGYETPVLLVSALGGLEDIAAELGVGYVQKPFDLDDLIAAVDQALTAPARADCIARS